MGRRRRRVIKVVKKKLPTVFTCPACGEETIRVQLPRGASSATVQCGSCGLRREIEATPSSQVVDIYCKFTDSFYAKGKPPQQEAPQDVHQETQEQPQQELQHESEQEPQQQAQQEPQTQPPA